MPEVSASCWISSVVICVGSGWRRLLAAMVSRVVLATGGVENELLFDVCCDEGG